MRPPTTFEEERRFPAAAAARPLSERARMMGCMLAFPTPAPSSSHAHTSLDVSLPVAVTARLSKGTSPSSRLCTLGGVISGPPQTHSRSLLGLGPTGLNFSRLFRPLLRPVQSFVVFYFVLLLSTDLSLLAALRKVCPFII